MRLVPRDGGPVTVVVALPDGGGGWRRALSPVDGTADLPNQTHHGFIWENGKMHNLPPVGGAPCSNASGINDRNEIVGNATNCRHSLAAVLWTDGSPVDLNTLIAPSTLHLTDALAINNAGQIIGEGVLPNGAVHIFLLTPNNP